HAHEPERDATGIARAGLHPLERDLHDQFRPHVYDVPFAADLAREQLARLPLERRVSETLERLAEHHEPAVFRVARAEVQVAEPALASSAAPLRGEDDEIERVGLFDLQPGTAATA